MRNSRISRRFARRLAPWFCLVALGSCPRAFGESPAIPADFPRFVVPEHQAALDSLRLLYWNHYPGCSPKATLWDGWLPAPALWPAVQENQWRERMRREWIQALDRRELDADGYVATHQHASVAHQRGWPFPAWQQGAGWGWHFSFENTVGPPWRTNSLSQQTDWTLSAAEDGGIAADGWHVNLRGSRVTIDAPPREGDVLDAPFVQIRWNTQALEGVQAALQWTTPERPDWSDDRRFPIEFVPAPAVSYTMVPLYKHPRWRGKVSRFRLTLDQVQPESQLVLQAFFTQYDTRHNINNSLFIRGCSQTFWWTGDVPFLARNISRMRLALEHLMTEHNALAEKIVLTPWIGHDGRSGLRLGADGTKQILSGHGVGNNYWDLLPFGHEDAYATILYYDAVRCLARIEQDVVDHPQWAIPPGRRSSADLARHAAEVRAEANRRFWNPQTGRFVGWIDADGKPHDHGFTFVNLEAIYYGLADEEHARSIMDWIAGERTVAGDAAQGADIYFWRFAPRATTRRNVDDYMWAWSGPESIPWGGQVQDGGAVLGFSFHDLMARLAVRGPDDAWARLSEIVRWFDEVRAAGGYRAYYDGSRPGTMQGGGVAGGLGLDQEFFESVLPPQTIVEGFMGISPMADGLAIAPRLPRSWSELIVDRIAWHERILKIRVRPGVIEIWPQDGSKEPLYVRTPGKVARCERLADDGRTLGPAAWIARPADGAVRVDWEKAGGVRIDYAGGP